MKTQMQLRGDAREILKLDSAEATRRMQSLSSDEQLQLVLSLEPGPRRQDLILRSDRPELLTRSMPEEDFTMTVKQIGDQDSLPLVEMSSNEQLAYLLDLDMWVKTDLDMQQVEHWLEIILECGPKRFLRWTDNADFELLVLLFERWCVLVDKEAILDLPDSVANRVISPDNYHHFLVKIGADMTLMRKITDLLFHEDKERFLAITGNLGTTPPAELEELVYRWRTARLADRGWPDEEEAAAFYQVLSADRIPSNTRLPTPAYQVPRFPLQQWWRGPLFPKALELTDDPDLQDKLALQVANLINRVIITDGLIAGDTQSMDEAAKIVSGRLEVGLVELGATDARSAKQIISKTPLIFVVQVANDAIMKRRTRAIALSKASTGGLLEYMQAPVPEQLQLLSRIRPVVLDEDGLLPRPIQSMSDLVALDSVMDLIEAALLLAQKLKIHSKKIRGQFSPGTYPSSAQELTLQAILATCFVRAFLGMDAEPAPVPMDDLRHLAQKLPEDSTSIIKELESWTTSLGQKRHPGLSRLLDQLARNLSQWLIRLGKTDVDPRYMKGLWVRMASID